ncbi:RlpA-like double-psi beta-barrel-protein domain-containing protein-containing protein [Lasiosphaeris hirsuta]|uniref:RlpA-like double-psi beta-barrel-protein domain-containing protein-containing protein n=1 Tax=Lasiosphaeris hirsuta TaxID=260670 RepID=A0AA40DIC5_9PEZI|nr:RlpA-like double-psi beta-barrel-protein domain-containing protein-containing protein [Lasiosphaeris hirsuta]
MKSVIAIPLAALLACTLATPINLAPSTPDTIGASDVDKRGNKPHHHGDMTYYEVGMGACGHDDSGKGNTDYIVAVSAGLMGDGGGDRRSMCGRQVVIKGSNGKQVTATVRDKCPSCEDGALDVSEKVFKDVVGDLGVGKTEVSWSIV